MPDAPWRRRTPAVIGWAVAGLAAWTVVAVWLNAFFVDDVIATFYDPQGYEQERDALRRGALALYTAGDHLGHGLAVLVGVALGVHQVSARVTLAVTAAAGFVLALAQAAVAATLTVPRLARWDEGGDHSFPATMLGDPVVLVPALVGLMLYPLLAVLGGWLGLRRGEQGFPGRRAGLEASGLWSLAGPFYLLTLDTGPPSGEGWAFVAICWLVPLVCLVLMLAKLSTVPRENSASPRP